MVKKIITLLNNALKLINMKLVLIEQNNVPSNRHNKYELESDNFEGMDRETRKVLNLLNYTKSSQAVYSAKSYDSAYHSIRLDNVEYSG